MEGPGTPNSLASPKHRRVALDYKEYEISVENPFYYSRHTRNVDTAVKNVAKNIFLITG